MRKLLGDLKQFWRSLLIRLGLRKSPVQDGSVDRTR